MDVSRVASEELERALDEHVGTPEQEEILEEQLESDAILDILEERTVPGMPEGRAIVIKSSDSQR